MDNQEQTKTELFCGFIKSFNSRRGFGFVSCEETAKRFQRDVYLSKDEAMMLADEPDVGVIDASATDGDQAKKPVPVQEGEFLLFQVKLSTEGFPQAVQAQKVHRLCGKVAQPPSSTSDGIIIVSGEDNNRGEVVSQRPDASVQELLGAEVKIRQAACGQLQLLPNDEVAFCCVNDGQALEAQLVDLLCTPRAAGSVLGCFSLKLPYSFIREAGEGFDDSVPACSKDGPSVEFCGHALTNRVVFPEMPSDVGVANMMRLFSKLGGAEPTVSPVKGNAAAGFVSIAFSGPETVAKFLIQTTHTISENGITQLAYVGSCLRRRGSDCCCVCEPMTSTGPLLSESSLGTMQLTPSTTPSTLQDTGSGAMALEMKDAAAAPSFPGPETPLCHPVAGLSMPVMLSPPMLPDWRCVHGSIVVSPSAPEVVASGENCCSLCVQWPTVVHASAYVVDILDLSTMISQQFMRGVSEILLPPLMDLRVDGLRSNQCVACVRCIAPCGCESPCSAWSYLPTAQPVVPATTLLLPQILPLPKGVGADQGVILHSCPPPPTAPPTLPSSVAQVPTVTLPAIPEESGKLLRNCSEECLTLD
jgi:hypothetical protein